MILTNWERQYKSVNQQDIPLATLGLGPENILLLACMHGDEPQGKYVLLKLLAYYEENKLALKGKRLVFVPVVNPDGYSATTRQNARQVDINRNFPTRNWVHNNPGDDFYSGPQPASEPETKMVIDLIERFPPKIIVTLHQPYKLINYDGPAEFYAQTMARYNKYEISDNIGYPTPGSFGTYAGIERNIPTITLELPENEPDAKVWKENQLALTACINSL